MRCNSELSLCLFLMYFFNWFTAGSHQHCLRVSSQQGGSQEGMCWATRLKRHWNSDSEQRHGWVSESVHITVWTERSADWLIQQVFVLKKSILSISSFKSGIRQHGGRYVDTLIFFFFFRKPPHSWNGYGGYEVVKLFQTIRCWTGQRHHIGSNTSLNAFIYRLNLSFDSIIHMVFSSLTQLVWHQDKVGMTGSRGGSYWGIL